MGKIEERSPEANKAALPSETTDIAVVFSLPFPLHLPDSIADGQHEQIRPEIYVAGSPPAGIHLIRRLRTENGISSPLEVEGGDPFGRFSFSDIQVRMNVEASPFLSTWEPKQLVEHSVSATNRLISHYRDLADQPMLRRVLPADLVHFRIIYLKSGQILHCLHHATAHGPLRGREVTEIEAIDAEIRARLQQVSEPDLFRDLELTMIRSLNENDFRGAVIEAAVLFESWLKAFLRDRFQSVGVSAATIEQMFLTKTKQHQKADYVARVLVKRATSLDFAQSPEYDAWRKRVADVRNNLVHGTRNYVSRDEAEACIKAIYQARDVIIAAVRKMDAAAGSSSV